MFEIAAPSLPSSAAGWLDLLVAVSLKATVLLASAALIALMLRRASAASRHLTWCLALAGLLALPALSLWGPAVRMKGLPLPSIEVSSARGNASLAPVGLPSSTPLASTQPPAPALIGPEAPGSVAPSSSIATPRPTTPVSWQALVLGVWALGAALVLATLLIGAFILARLSRRARPIADPDWLDLAADCAAALGLTRRFELSSSEQIPMPCAWGVLRARVLIPAAADQWSQERKRVVLLHELGHVARRDCLVQTLAQVACAVFWFHPLVWLAARRLRIEREHACDDLVLAAEVGPADYAEHLLAVVRAMRAADLRAIGAVAFARRSQFEGRLLAVLDPDQPRGAVTARRVWRTALAAALVIVPVAALRPWTGPANAGLTLLDGTRSRPEDGAPSSFEEAPESEVGLARRMAWAMSRGSKGNDEGFWIAYQVARYDKAGGNLTDNGALDLRTLDDQWPGPRMADVLAGRSARDPKVVPDRDGLVVAYHFAGDGAGPGDVDRVRAQSLELAAAFGQQPLFWLGNAEDHESLDWLRKVERAASKKNLRSAALDAIALHSDDEAVRTHLTTVLRSDVPRDLRASAAERLGRFSDSKTVSLLTSTAREDRSAEVREAAIAGLGRMRSTESTRFLSSLARDRSQSEDARRLAVEALGEKASAEAAETLESLVDPEDEEGVELSDVKIVPREGGQDVMILDDHGDPEVTIQQRSADSEGKQETKSKKHSEKKHQEELEEKEKLEEKREQQRESAKQDEQEAIQRQAVQSLARLPESNSLPKLIKIARSHESRGVRREAASALGQIGSPKAIEALHDLAWQEGDDEVARQAVDALGQSENALPEIIDVARRHKRTAVRREAVQTISRMGPQRQVLDLLDDLVRSDDDQEVQREAVSSISQLPESFSLSRLEKIARTHPRAEVRRQAIDELARFDPERVTPILESLIEHGRK